MVAVVGFFLVPDGASVPIHASFDGFDGFAPKGQALGTLVFTPLLVTLALIFGWWMTQASPVARFLLSIIAFAAAVTLLIFNILAVRYGMS